MHKILVLFLIIFLYTFAVRSGSDEDVYETPEISYDSDAELDPKDGPDTPNIPDTSYLEENFEFIKRNEKGTFRLTTEKRGLVDYQWLREKKILSIKFTPCVGEKIRVTTLEFSITDKGELDITNKPSLRSFGEKPPRAIKKTNIDYIIELIEALKTIK